MVPREDSQNDPGSDVGPQFSHMLTEGLLVVVQELWRHIFRGVVSRHFAKYKHLGTTFIVTTNWVCDSSKNFSLFRFNPGFSYCAWPLGIHSRPGQGFTSVGLPLLTHITLGLPFLTLSPASSFLAPGFFSLVSSFSVSSTSILQDGKERIIS